MKIQRNTIHLRLSEFHFVPINVVVGFFRVELVIYILNKTVKKVNSEKKSRKGPRMLPCGTPPITKADDVVATHTLITID